MWNNHLSPSGAETLALRLKNYWAERGYAVDTWIEQTVTDDVPACAGTAKMYGVRTNMVNGAPRGAGHVNSWAFKRYP